MRYAEMKYLFTLTILIFLIGCSPDHTYKYFDFEDSESDIGFGVLSVGLRGKFILVNSSEKMKITHKGSPYELWMWFQTDNKDIHNINISNISIRHKDGELMQEYSGGDLLVKWSDYKNAYSGGWSLKGLNLNHVPLQIRFKVTIRIGKETIEKEITADLGIVYREERANDFWSMLMSV